MNIKQLREFVVVAQERQITAAAKRLYMAQPPLSYQMKQLEKEVGTKLMVRTPYGIRLTDAGITFLSYAQQITRIAGNASEAIHLQKAGKLGVIHLGLISSLGQLLPNKALQQFSHYYPHVKFEITENNTFELVKQLNRNLIDLAVMRTPFNHRHLNTRTIHSDKMVAVFNPQRTNVSKQSLSIKDFNEQPIVLYSRFESLINRTFAEKGVDPFVAVRCDNALTAVTWARAGMGIAIVPESTVHNQQYTPIDYPDWETKIQLAWRKDQSVKPVIKQTIQWLSQNK